MPDWLFTGEMWKALFAAGGPLLEKLLRPLLIYVGVVLLLRIFGKRELAQLNQFDLVVLLVLSESVQNGIIGSDTSVTGAILAAFVLLGVNSLVVRFLYRHRRLDHMVEGKPTLLIENGRILKKALAEELMTESELMTAVHGQGVDHVDEVARCVLEPGGVFSVERKRPGPEERQHQEVMASIEELRRKLDRLLEERAV
jgi:uncharacterized membrane protein YcaP (DUF421 family)